MSLSIIYNFGQTVLSYVDGVKQFRINSALAQKTLQISCSILNGFILPKFPNKNLEKFSFSLEATAGMFDTYRIVQDVYRFFFPISASSINENEVLDSLQSVNSNLFKEREQTIIKKLLSEMSQKNFSYRNIDEFKAVLINRLNKDHIPIFPKDFPYKTKKWLRSSSFLAKTISVLWTVVDASCVVDRLRQWKLLDTAKLAASIGQLPLLGWVKKHSLGQWIVGLVFTGFALQVVESARKLAAASKTPLTPQDHREARWSAFSSFTESVLFGTIFLSMKGKTIDVQAIDAWRIASKFIGSYRITSRPAHEYFQKS